MEQGAGEQENCVVVFCEPSAADARREGDSGGLLDSRSPAWSRQRCSRWRHRDHPPNATTISRALAGCSLADFWPAFAAWLRCVALSDEPITVAVDGKTACQGLDEHGNPVQLLTVFVHQLKLVLGQWSVTGEKTNEPTVLKRHVAELLEAFPMLALLTGDALYAQRPLAEVLTASKCHYLLAIKANQPDMLDALVTCLGQAHERPPAAETAEKRGIGWIVADYGSAWMMPIMSASN